MRKSWICLCCLLVTIFLPACQQPSSNLKVPAHLLAKAENDPEEFGATIMMMEQRLADNQAQLPKWSHGMANYILLQQSIASDKIKIAQMLQTLSELDNTGNNG